MDEQKKLSIHILSLLKDELEKADAFFIWLKENELYDSFSENLENLFTFLTQYQESNDRGN